ncbi:hypothetical protein V6Z12_A13G030600 [Gossypium hirsutum]
MLNYTSTKIAQLEITILWLHCKLPNEHKQSISQNLCKIYSHEYSDLGVSIWTEYVKRSYLQTHVRIGVKTLVSNTGISRKSELGQHKRKRYQNTIYIEKSSETLQLRSP